MTRSRLVTRVGDVRLSSPILTAAGTAGFGTELADYGDLRELGALVTKSLASFPWEGNASPRVAPSGAAMLNSVGLAGPGVASWRDHEYLALRKQGAAIVASVWGRSVAEFESAVRELAGLDLAAIEINASCPNLEGRSGIFAHSAELVRDILHATEVATVPRWIKLSPNTPELVAIASAAVDAGADALVIANTLLGMDIDVETGRPTLGNGGGGVSGHPIFPVALRCVFEVRSAMPSVPIIGAGGIASARDALAMMMAGAAAVQIGTAGFADPRIYWRVARDIDRWLKRHGHEEVLSVLNAAHGEAR